MNGIWCGLSGLLIWVVNIYSIVLFVYAILSWFPDARGIMRFLAPVVEPVMAPLRRIIPPLGGFDLAFLVVIIALQVLIRPLLYAAQFNACSPY